MFAFDVGYFWFWLEDLSLWSSSTTRLTRVELELFDRPYAEP